MGAGPGAELTRDGGNFSRGYSTRHKRGGGETPCRGCRRLHGRAFACAGRVGPPPSGGGRVRRVVGHGPASWWTSRWWWPHSSTPLSVAVGAAVAPPGDVVDVGPAHRAAAVLALGHGELQPPSRSSTARRCATDHTRVSRPTSSTCEVALVSARTIPLSHARRRIVSAARSLPKGRCQPRRRCPAASRRGRRRSCGA